MEEHSKNGQEIVVEESKNEGPLAASDAPCAPSAPSATKKRKLKVQEATLPASPSSSPDDMTQQELLVALGKVALRLEDQFSVGKCINTC